MDNEELFLWLSMSDMPVKKLYDLVNEFDNLNDLCQTKTYDYRIRRHLTKEEFASLLSLRESESYKKLLSNLPRSHIKFVTIVSPDYPRCFRALEVPPLVIYYVGDLSLLNKLCIAIVGTRKCTKYGADLTEKFAKELAIAGCGIVSGLAEGIDVHAHIGALEAKGKTIAVLAGGLNYIYPASNVQIARNIIENGGLIISELAPDTSPQSYTFIQRNRLIAAASSGVLVTEAGAKSGAMHTVNFALDLGKDIFAVPGNVTSKSSIGTNQLIKQFYTSCVTGPEDILGIIMPTYRKEQVKNEIKEMSNEEKSVCDILQDGEAHFDEIAQKSQINVKSLIGLLTMMEIRGLIKKLPSNYYALEE
ncbi:MAG: DNA-processing protein DprA [Clostridia bacterium]|nr:DNA-processing protein DprA [Clostridia bacterium]